MKRLIFFSFLSFFSLCGLANDDSQKEDTIQTIYLNNAVIISAQRLETNSYERSESIGYLDKTQLEVISPMSTPQALSNVPGVWMQRTNHGGGSAFVRGLTGYQTLLIVDGIRMNNSTFRSGPNQYLNTIDPLSIGSVEVLRGSGSVQYGSDAIGGAIHIHSKEPVFRNGQKTRVSGNLYGKYWSSNMEMSGRGELQVSNDRFALLTGFSYKNFGDIKAGGSLGTLKPTGYNEYDFDLKAAYKFDNNHKLIATYQHVNQQDVPLYHKVVTGEYSRYHFQPQSRDFAYLRYISTYQSKLLNQIKYTLSYQNSLEVREKQKTGSNEILEEKDEVNTAGFNIDIISVLSDRWSASSGLEYYFDHIGSNATLYDQEFDESTLLRGLYPDGSQYHNLAVFSLHQFSLPKWNISAGLRYNFVNLQVQDTVFGNTSISPDALVGSLGIVYKLSDHHHLTANLNSAFRAPNVNDVSSFGIADFRYEVPAYDLKPETSLNKEIGYKFRFDNVSGAIHGYHIKLNDLIANVPAQYQGQDSLDGYKIYQRENINEAFIYGGEVELEAKLSNLFNAFGNLTYTFGENVSKNEPMRRIPPLFGKLGIKGHWMNKYHFIAEYVLSGEQTRLSSGDIADDRIADGGTPGWNVLNLYGGYSYEYITIRLGLENLFNTAYRVHGSGIDGIGRSFWLSLQLRLNS